MICHEVVDLDTGQPLPDGERGALAITLLARRGTVLLRYLVGDIVDPRALPALRPHWRSHCGTGGAHQHRPSLATRPRAYGVAGETHVP